MSDLDPGKSRGLSRVTLERLSREWDRRVGTGPHSISAEKTSDGENVIFIFEGVKYPVFQEHFLSIFVYT
ncbi:MAG: hypothetical protein AABZ06_04765, partial [Bdellovibrionota bacterium]